MECMNTVFPVILYILGTILLVILIILCLKVIGTLKKVDQVVDDVEEKVSKLDGVFNIIDRSTDAVSAISDRVIDFISESVTKVFSRKKTKRKKKEEKIDE